MRVGGENRSIGEEKKQIERKEEKQIERKRRKVIMIRKT